MTKNRGALVHIDQRNLTHEWEQTYHFILTTLGHCILFLYLCYFIYEYFLVLERFLGRILMDHVDLFIMLLHMP